MPLFDGQQSAVNVGYTQQHEVTQCITNHPLRDYLNNSTRSSTENSQGQKQWKNENPTCFSTENEYGNQHHHQPKRLHGGKNSAHTQTATPTIHHYVTNGSPAKFNSHIHVLLKKFDMLLLNTSTTILTGQYTEKFQQNNRRKRERIESFNSDAKKKNKPRRKHPSSANSHRTFMFENDEKSR